MADSATALLGVTTTGGFLLVLSLVVPVAGVLLAFAAGGRHVERIAPVIMALGFVIAGVIAVAMCRRALRSSICSAGGRRRWVWRCARTGSRRS